MLKQNFQEKVATGKTPFCTISPEKGNHVFLHYCINKVLNAQDSKVV